MTPPCDHTLHLRDQQGRRIGSWAEERTEHGVRVACRYCGKFYGYCDPKREPTPEQLRQAYLEQQRRRSCPGCGEEPFLG